MEVTERIVDFVVAGRYEAIHSSQVLIVPVQSPTSMTLYSAGYFDVGEMVRSGLLMAAMLIAVTLLFAQLYWPLAGAPPRG